MAETNAWREEQPRERQEEEESSREDSVDSEETVGEVQWTEEERIARAIKGEGEFLSEELKKLLREIESACNLRIGVLAEEMEARLRGVKEPSMEKLKQALREEITMVEEKFLTRNPNPRGEGVAEDQAPQWMESAGSQLMTSQRSQGEVQEEIREQEHFRPGKHRWAGKAFMYPMWTTH